MEIVKLIGADVLPDDQKLIIETAKVVRVGFLQQNAYHPDDTYVPLEKQLYMMRAIVRLYHLSLEALKAGATLSAVLSLGYFERVTKVKFEIPNSKPEKFAELIAEMEEAFASLT